MKTKEIKTYLPTILFGLLVLFLSLMPGSENEKKPFFYFEGIDKLIHAGMYLVFTFLFIYDYKKNNVLKTKTLLIISVSILSFSILMEILQYYFIPFRSGDILDVTANLSGILLAILIHRQFQLSFQHKK